MLGKQKKFNSKCLTIDGNNEWRLMAFINGGASKTTIKMSKSSIRRLSKFKGGVNKFLTKNAIFNTNLYLYKVVSSSLLYLSENVDDFVVVISDFANILVVYRQQWWIFQFRGPRQEFSKIHVV